MSSIELNIRILLDNWHLYTNQLGHQKRKELVMGIIDYTGYAGVSQELTIFIRKNLQKYPLNVLMHEAADDEKVMRVKYDNFHYKSVFAPTKFSLYLDALLSVDTRSRFLSLMKR